jgi:polyhydroxybutyrate depolymerase
MFHGHLSAVLFVLSLAVAVTACSGDDQPALDSDTLPPRDGQTEAAHHLTDTIPTEDQGVPGQDTGSIPQDTGSVATFDGKPGEFTGSASGRTYRLLVPAGYLHSKPIPLVVAFHGAGDSGANFYAICKAAGWAAAAAPASFILLVPDTKSPYKDFAIWSGNPSNDVVPMKQEMAEIIAIINEIGIHYHLDQKQIHALGFSDGGLFVAVTGMDRADLFASLGILAYGWGSNYPLVTPKRKIAVQFAVGTNDSFYSSAQGSESYLKGKGHPTRLLTASGVGHSFLGLMQQHSAAALFSWMKQHPLP